MSDHDVVADFDGKQERSPRSRIINTLAQNTAQGRENSWKPGGQIMERHGEHHQHIQLRRAGKLQRKLEPRTVGPLFAVRRRDFTNLTGYQPQAAAVESTAEWYRHGPRPIPAEL